MPSILFLLVAHLDLRLAIRTGLASFHPSQFLQCLASPNYLYELASKGYLDDPKFINYLDYLSYWRRPDYAQFIKYVSS